MRTDYHVMWWTGGTLPWEEGGGPWTDEARQRYIDGGYDGVFCQFGHALTHSDLNFLAELPGVRYLEVVGAVEDDTAAFQLPELEELILATGSKCAIPSPFTAQQELRYLLVNNRPNMEAVQDMPDLRGMKVLLWDGEDLGFLGQKPALERLDIEGTGRHFSLAGVEGCTAMAELEVTQACVRSLAPLRSLTALRRLWLIGDHRIPRDNCLDLSDLQGLSSLEELRLTFGGQVSSLSPVLAFPNLRDLRLRGTTVMDGDLSPLDRLPPTVHVVSPDD